MTRTCLRKIVGSCRKHLLVVHNCKNCKMSTFADDGLSSEIISSASPAENPIILERPTISRSQSASSRAGRRTLVILLGWAACPDEHLKKYSAIYTQKSCSVLRHTCPVSPSFSADYYAEHGRRLIDALETAKVIREDFASVIFHVFSQHGCSLFEAIWTLLGSTPDGLRLKSDLTKAVVFDSCPALPNAHESAMALTIINDHGTPQALSVFNTRYVAYLLAFCVKNAMNKMFRPTRFVYHRLLAHDTLPGRQLYFYSDADVLCSARTIAAFARLQAGQERKVTECRWTDSPHVNHFRTHPREYVTACQQLVDEMASGNSSKL